MPYSLAMENNDPKKAVLGEGVCLWKMLTECISLGFWWVVSGDCLKNNPWSLREMSKFSLTLLWVQGLIWAMPTGGSMPRWGWPLQCQHHSWTEQIPWVPGFQVSRVCGEIWKTVQILVEEFSPSSSPSLPLRDSWALVTLAKRQGPLEGGPGPGSSQNPLVRVGPCTIGGGRHEFVVLFLCHLPSTNFSHIQCMVTRGNTREVPVSELGSHTKDVSRCR